MGLIPTQHSLHAQSTKLTLSAVFVLLIAVSRFAAPQTPQANKSAADVIAANSRPELPDSPGVLFSSSSSSADPGSASIDSAPKPVFKHSPHLQMVVLPDQIADPMTVHEKVSAGLKNSVSPFSAAGWIAAARWGELTDGSPNYGSDAGAFGQRLGAAALRSTSNNVLSHSVFASIFHEDPRYYVMGSGHPFVKRLVYASTRSIITRTDSGRSTPNYALLAGSAASSALTVTYYPARNNTFSGVAQTFGGSVGGSALSFVVDEFLVDALVDLKLKKKQ